MITNTTMAVHADMIITMNMIITIMIIMTIVPADITIENTNGAGAGIRTQEPLGTGS